MRTGRRRLAVVTAAWLGVAGLGAVGAGTAGAAGPRAAGADAVPVAVTVDAHAGLGTVPPLGLGANDAVWDAKLGTDATSGLLRRAGVRMMRYPGGSYADIYHWKDNTAPGGYVAPGTDFDTFMASVQHAGAQPIVIANYGTGTAQEAADWVRYANVTKRYHATYWEIGNENYGNGHYGSNWEADDHADKSPTAYANGVVEYAKAMKAVDPTVRIGAVLTTPGNWPDGIVADGDSGTWNRTVLSIAGPSIDFAVLHWYPGGSGAADALSKPAQAVDIAELTRAQITRYAGAGSGRIGIALSELNAGAGVNTQPGALFAADAYLSLWAAGVFTVDWWDLRNGIDKVTTVAGQTDYNDFGLLSSGTCLKDDPTVCEPAADTPFAPYHALELLGSFADPGDQLVRVTTGDPLVHAHAVRHRDGDLSVLLLNEDPASARTVSLSYAGYVPSPDRPVVSTFLNGASAIAHGRAGTAGGQTLPPYSLTAIEVHQKFSRTLPPAPSTPVVSAVTDTSASAAWTPAPRARPGTVYEVYVQDAAGSRLAGTTPGTSLVVTGLRAGTRYTVTVVATEPNGASSWSSAPGAFVTGTPSVSTCAVHLVDASDWGNGYVGSVDVTNTGTEPVHGWTLGFAFPRPWESFGSGWNATWSADGVSVTASNVDWNADVAPGATVNVGYVGNYAGPNVLPTVVTFNGAVFTSR